MSGADALLWTISTDPVMRPTIVAVMILAGSPAWSEVRARVGELTQTLPRLRSPRSVTRAGTGPSAVRAGLRLRPGPPPATRAHRRSRRPARRARHGADHGDQRVRPRASSMGGGAGRGPRRRGVRARDEGASRADRRGGRVGRLGCLVRRPGSGLGRRPAGRNDDAGNGVWRRRSRCGLIGALSRRPVRGRQARRRCTRRRATPHPQLGTLGRRRRVRRTPHGSGRPARLTDHARARLPAPRRGHRRAGRRSPAGRTRLAGNDQRRLRRVRCPGSRPVPRTTRHHELRVPRPHAGQRPRPGRPRRGQPLRPGPLRDPGARRSGGHRGRGPAVDRQRGSRRPASLSARCCPTG